MPYSIRENMKLCSKCGEAKSLVEFGRDNRRPDGWGARCLGCNRAYFEEWLIRPGNADRKRAHGRKTARKRDNVRARYGITTADVQRMILDQGGRCAICVRAFARLTTSPHVDHDHENGFVRSILCLTCNVVVGNVEKGWGVAVPAIFRYLEVYS